MRSHTQLRGHFHHLLRASSILKVEIPGCSILAVEVPLLKVQYMLCIAMLCATNALSFLGLLFRPSTVIKRATGCGHQVPLLGDGPVPWPLPNA